MSAHLQHQLATWAQALRNSPEGGPLPPLADLDDATLRTPEDVHALADALACVARLPDAVNPEERYVSEEDRQHNKSFVNLLHLLRKVATPQAANALDSSAVPDHLQRLIRNGLTRAQVNQDLLMLTLRQLARMPRRQDAELVVQAFHTRQPLDLRHEYAWTALLAAYDQEHPQTDWFFERMASADLPDGMATLALLDAANRHWLGQLTRGSPIAAPHPFDRPEGLHHLGRWLTQPKPGHEHYAISATAALPHLRNPEAAALLKAAQTWPSEQVQLHAAWACLRMAHTTAAQQAAARKHLIKACLTPHLHQDATGCLHELGLSELVPAQTQTEDFQALCEMSQWLSQPNEFGQPPDELHCVHQCTLHWPPTGDERRLHVFRYRYTAKNGPRQQGFGLVGSTTFALADQAPRMSPQDVLALHCAWEMHRQQAPGFEHDYTLAQGRALLQQHNPQLC